MAGQGAWSRPASPGRTPTIPSTANTPGSGKAQFSRPETFFVALCRLSPLFWILLFDLGCAALEAGRVPFRAPNSESLCDALEFSARHRIASDFLPIGYSGLLGLAHLLAGQNGLIAISIAFSLVLVSAAWFYLRTIGISPGACICLCLALSLYPDFFMNYVKGWDTALTAAVLFAYVALLVRQLRSGRGNDTTLYLGVLIGFGISARPNLLLFLPLTVIVLLVLRVPGLLRRCVLLTVAAFALYAIVTVGFHGRVFFPANGPYNLYAGNNEFTAEHLSNQEDSLVSALALHGIHAEAPSSCVWSTQLGGGVNVRSPSLTPVYRSQFKEFIRTHPGAVVHLAVAKLGSMMAPDLRLYSAHSLGGTLKSIAALAFPLWLAGLLLWPHPGPKNMRVILLLVVATYLLPFAVSISSPRFRVPLDYFCWVDLGAMVVARWWNGAYRTSAGE